MKSKLNALDKHINDAIQRVNTACILKQNFDHSRLIVKKFVDDGLVTTQTDTSGTTVDMTSKLVSYEALLSKLEQKSGIFVNLKRSKDNLAASLEFFEIENKNDDVTKLNTDCEELMNYRQSLTNDCFSLLNKTRGDLESRKKILELDNCLDELLGSGNVDKEIILQGLSNIEIELQSLPKSHGVVTDLDFDAVQNKVESYKEQIKEAREKESSLGKQITELETYIDKFQKWLDQDVEPEIESKNAQNPGNKLEFYKKMNELNQNMLTQKPHINQTYERIVELSKSADSYQKTNTVQKLLAEATVRSKIWSGSEIWSFLRFLG